MTASLIVADECGSKKLPVLLNTFLYFWTCLLLDLWFTNPSTGNFCSGGSRKVFTHCAASSLYNCPSPHRHSQFSKIWSRHQASTIYMRDSEYKLVSKLKENLSKISSASVTMSAPPLGPDPVKMTCPHCQAAVSCLLYSNSLIISWSCSRSQQMSARRPRAQAGWSAWAAASSAADRAPPASSAANLTKMPPTPVQHANDTSANTKPSLDLEEDDQIFVSQKSCLILYLGWEIQVYS